MRDECGTRCAHAFFPTVTSMWRETSNSRMADACTPSAAMGSVSTSPCPTRKVWSGNG